MVLNGSKLEWAPVLSGVPQGSVLGPLLFILYVNDIPDLVHCNIKMFADDIKVFTHVRSQEDQEHLQCNIATLEDGTKDWLLEFNSDKCKLMQVGRPPHRNSTMTNKSGARVDLESINEEKDVGVWVTTDVKSSTQCQKASKKAMQSSWHGEEILQTHNNRFICDIIQSIICPTTPRILCSDMEPVHGERPRQSRESATQSH